MLVFHYKYHIGSIDQLLIDFDPCFVAGTGRTGLVQRMIFEQQFGGGAAPLIFTTDEKKIGQDEL